MSGSQYIILGVVALTTWVSFIEASAHPGHRVTTSRFVLALLGPLLYVVLIVYLPIEGWLSTARDPALTSEIFRRFVVFPLGLLAIVTAPIWFIFPIILWVGAALCGDTKQELQKVVGHFRRGKIK